MPDRHEREVRPETYHSNGSARCGAGEPNASDYTIKSTALTCGMSRAAIARTSAACAAFVLALMAAFESFGWLVGRMKGWW